MKNTPARLHFFTFYTYAPLPNFTSSITNLTIKPRSSGAGSLPDRTMKLIQIEYSGMRPIVQQAVCMTNQLLRDIRFYERIATLPQFDMADVPPAELARLMYKTDIKIKVELYNAISPVENIDLYADDAHPNILQLNIWTLNRPVASVCNILLHGCVHAVNAVHNQY